MKPIKAIRINFDQTPSIEVPAIGPLDAQVVFIGEAPASEEFRAKQPFVGDAGQRLRKYCRYAGLDIEEVRITNVSKERAPSYKIERMPEERKSFWRGSLIQEINDMPNPKILVAFGNFATQALTSRTGITKLRGSLMKPIKAIRHRCAVIPTIHPASIGYGNYENWAYIVADLVRVKRLMENDCNFEFPNFRFIVRPTIVQVINKLEWMEENPDKMYTLDVETPNGVLSCIGMAWSKSDAICIPFCYGSGKPYWTQSEEELIWRTLGRVLPKLSIHNQNWMFDWEILLEHHIKLKIPQWDPMMMHHCLYSSMKHTLDMITSIYTDIAYYKSDTREEEGVKGSSLRAGLEGQHWEYNCLDCVAAWWSIEELKQELIDEEMMKIYQLFYVDVYEILFRMNLTGARIDMRALKEHRRALEEENQSLKEELNIIYKKHLEENKIIIADEITRKIKKKNDDPEFKLEKSKRQFKKAFDKKMQKEFLPNSSDMTKELLIDFMNLTPYKDRSSGNISMSAENLERLSHKYKIEAPLWIVQYRKNAKELGLFSDENIVDGRIRTRYSPRTDTGRLSSRKGFRGTGMNLQNVKRGKTRKFFVAEIGEVLLGADLCQAEARIVAWYSRDPNMIKIVESGQIHLKNFETLFKMPADKKHPLYTIAKSLVHGGNYGIGKLQFALVAKLSSKEAEEYLNLYHAAYPGIRSVYHKYVENEIITKRVLYNPFGRRMPIFKRFDAKTFKEGYAFIPQSSVTDINKIALKRISKFKWPLLDTHDGMLLSVPKDQIDEGIKALKEAYNVPFKIWGETHIIPVEITIGDNWYEMTEVK
jgi:uracil-DNA glycosylase family 4